MSIDIHHFVVHQIGLNNDEALTLVPRGSCLNSSAQLEMLCEQLNHAFNSKPGKGVGGFSDEKPDFHQQLDDCLVQGDILDEARFLPFSTQAGQLLIQAMINCGMVETGFLLFAHYRHLATDYLLITLLNTREHIEVDSALELSAKEHLDLSRMQLAVKIDLTEYRINRDKARYIAFIKGRMGRKVSDFFMQFIGCEEQVDSREQNKLLATSVDAFLAEAELDPDERNQHRQQVREYMKGQADGGENVVVAEVAEQLPQTGGREQDFMAFVAKQETPIEPDFSPDPSVIRQMAKFSGQGGGVSLAFERKLLGDRIVFDPVTDTITIKGIPPNLKDQLIRATSAGHEE